jgi:hypothetical protein
VTADDWVDVRLLNFPVRLHEQASEHHEELMREFALLSLRPPEERPGHAVPRRLLELVDLLGRQYAGLGADTDAVRDAAAARGEDAVDLTYTVPRSIGDAMRGLYDLLEEADSFCESEDLLTLASTPVERQFRRWFIDQFSSQAAGAEPVPWEGPMTADDLAVPAR